MREKREFEGKDLDEAIQMAAQELAIPEAELHYEVVDQGRKGLLGLGAKSVRIRVKPPVEHLTDREIMEGEAEPQPERGTSEQAQEVERTLQRMLELVGLKLKAHCLPQDSGVSVHLDGADQKLLKQRNAELLLALQFLLNRMARRAWPGVGRIHLTTNGESRKRDDRLVAMARQVAQQVSRTGRTRKLRPMNAYERRIVHLTVREFSGLTSSSDGNGSMKRVRISKVQNALKV
jgi:spoIIIJ-associated protein